MGSILSENKYEVRMQTSSYLSTVQNKHQISSNRMMFTCYLSLVCKSKRSIYKSLNTTRPLLFYSDGFSVITFCALGLPAHSRGGGIRKTRARSCCWCWWCLLIMLFSLSHSGGNRGATFASNYFNLRPRLPLWTDRQTDRQTPWHNYCGIEMTLG